VKIDGEMKTTEGRPFLAVVITSEANMGNLEAIRQANLRLADPRGLSDDEAKKLLATAKVIIGHNHGIHSTEVGAPQTSMELAYTLATSQDPRILDILDKAVIVMLPSHNPDGTQMVVDWYKKSLGTAWEGAELPFLYHHYTGHDNNRDWYMFTQAESQDTAKLLYDRWKPPDRPRPSPDGQQRRPHFRARLCRPRGGRTLILPWSLPPTASALTWQRDSRARASGAWSSTPCTTCGHPPVSTL